MFFENYKVYETTLAGRPLKLETGKMAQLANAAVLASYGETVVLCTVTASDKPREGIDFFPLSVDFEEKMYSVGRIPGSFQRRESRPSEKAILASRCIDRPIRPLFPKDLRNDCTVIATVMSVDPDYRHRHLRHPVGRPHLLCPGRPRRRRDRHQPDPRAESCLRPQADRFLH